MANSLRTTDSIKSMTDLSISAQAILTAQAKQRCLNEWDHVNDPPCHPSDDDWNGCYQCIDRRGLAAALRVTADQVFPTMQSPWGSTLIPVLTSWESRAKLLAIAAELEAQ